MRSEQETDTQARTTSATPRRTGSRRRRRVLVAAVAVLLLVLVAGTLAAGWYGSEISVRPQHGSPGGDRPETVLGVRPGNGAPVVALTVSTATTRPGTYGLAWGDARAPGGEGTAMLGDIVTAGPDRVERPLLSGAVPPTGAPATMSDSYPGNPRSALGLAYSDVSVATELGPAPAWYIPAAGPGSSTWAITVHGSNAKRNADLRAAATMHRAGLPVLSITYRNDDGAPASPDGLMHLGASEWRDLEAAVRTAQGLGAGRVVLFGGSMGGTVVGEFLTWSPLAAAVSAVVLDAPMLSSSQTSAFAVGQMHLPSVLATLGDRITSWRIGTDIARIDFLTHPPRYRPPTLILNGGADDEHPPQYARDLAAAGPRLTWPIRYEEFPGAGHGRAWNTDPGRYDAVLADFLARTASRG